MTFNSALERLDQSFALVGAMFGGLHRCAALLHQRPKKHGIVLGDLPLIQFRSQRDDPVASRNDCCVYLTADCHISKTLGSQKSNRRWTNPFAAPENFLAFC